MHKNLKKYRKLLDKKIFKSYYEGRLQKEYISGKRKNKNFI